MAEKMKMNSGVRLILIFAWVAIAASRIITFGYGMMMPGIMQEPGLDTGQIGRLGGIASWLVVLTLFLPELGYKKMAALKAAAEAQKTA